MNLIVIDSSQGDSIYQLDLIKHLKSEYKIQVIGGNVVTAMQAYHLIQAGVDGIYIYIFHDFATFFLLFFVLFSHNYK